MATTRARAVMVGMGLGDTREPFRVRDAMADGMPRSRMRRRDLRRDFDGVRTPAAIPDSLRARCASLQLLLDERHAFTGITAARLWGMPLPRRLETVTDLHVATAEPGRAIRHRRTVGSECPAWWRSVLVDGLRIHRVPETWLSLGRSLSVADLVAVADFAVTPTRRRPSLTTPGELAALVARGTGMVGIGRLRQATARVRIGARSRPETLLRLLLEDAGLPEPRLNESVMLRSGREVIPDLSWPAFRVVVEYDGIYHREPEQFARDLVRTDELVDDGWLVVHVVAAQLFRTPAEIVARVTRRLASRGCPTRSVTRFPAFEP